MGNETENNTQQEPKQTVEENSTELLDSSSKKTASKSTESKTPAPDNTQSSESDQIKKPNQMGIIIGAVAAIVAIGFIGLFLLPRFFMTGKKVVDKEVTYLFSQARQELKENKKNIIQYDLDKDSLGIEGTLSIESDYKADGIDLSKLKNYQLEYSGTIDKKKNEASATVGLVNKDKKMIDIDAYIEGKEAYLALNDLYNKTIKTKLEKEIKELDLSTNQNLEDIDKLLEKTEIIVKDTIKDKDIKKTKETKEFNGKKEKYTKVEYTVKNQEFTKEIIEAYQKDDEIIKILANLTQKTEKDVKKMLEDAIDDLKDTNNDTTTTFNIYLKGLIGKAQAFELIDDNDILEVVKDNNVYKYSYKSNSKEVFNGEYNQKEKVFTMKSKEGLSLKAILDPTATKIDLNYEIGSQSLKINAIINNKVSNSTQDNDTTIKFEYNASGEKITATIYNKMKLEKNKKADQIDTNNTVDMDSITEEEMENIELKLYEKLNQLINDIMPGLSNGTTDFRELI